MPQERAAAFGSDGSVAARPSAASAKAACAAQRSPKPKAELRSAAPSARAPPAAELSERSELRGILKGDKSAGLREAIQRDESGAADARVVERAPCSPVAIEPVGAADGERCPEGCAGGTHSPIERPPAQPVAHEPTRAAVTGCIDMERTSGSGAASWEAAHPLDPERDDSEIQRILANSLQQLSKVVEWHSEPDDSDLSSGLFAQVRL